MGDMRLPSRSSFGVEAHVAFQPRRRYGVEVRAPGGLNMTEISRHPQRGQIRRSAIRAMRKSRSLVQTSVSRSS
jgi:hypothetical protein